MSSEEETELLAREDLLRLDTETIDNLLESLDGMEPEAEAILVGEEEEVIRIGMRLDEGGPLIVMSAKALSGWLRMHYPEIGPSWEIPAGTTPQRVLPDEMFSSLGDTVHSYEMETAEQGQLPLGEGSLHQTMMRTLLSVGVGMYLQPDAMSATLHDIDIEGTFELDLWSDEHESTSNVRTTEGLSLRWERPHSLARDSHLVIYEHGSYRILAQTHHDRWLGDEEPGSPSYEHLRIQAA